MGATLFREHKVFKMDLGIKAGSLFGQETVIVASLRCEKNVYPADYSWGIEFIGGVDTFLNRYLSETGYFFDNRLSQANHINSGVEYIRKIKALYNFAAPLTVSRLRDIGFYGYSWPDESITHITDCSHLMKFSDYLGVRHAAKLDHEKDVEWMIREAYEVVPADSKHLWLGRLWRLDYVDVNDLRFPALSPS